MLPMSSEPPEPPEGAVRHSALPLNSAALLSLGPSQGPQPHAAPVHVLSSSVLFAHRLHSPWVPSCLGQPRVLQGRLARSLPSLWDR